MNIVTDYTKNQLDRSSYVSEDRYKRALDLNRIRLATQKVIGLSNRYAYYYNEAMYKKLVAMIPSRYNINAGLGNLAIIDNNRIIDTTNDEDQLRMAEETYGKETIEAIIDVVTGDDDLGDYDKPEDEIKQEAEEQADSDSDSDEIKIPPFDIPGKTNPITETTKETGGKTVQETVEEITKTGTNPDGTTPESSHPGAILTAPEGTKGFDRETGKTTITVNGDGTVTISNDDGSTTITDVDIVELYDNGTQLITGKDDDGRTVQVWSDTHIAEPTSTPEDHWNDHWNDPWPDDARGDPPCDTPPCDSGGCTGDCDCDCDCDTPPSNEPPCNEPCDGGGCTNDCNDCCIGDGGCQSGDSCGDCDCCVNDCISCNCDCGSDCDNYGDCIDSCGGNE